MIFTLWPTWTARSTIQQVVFFFVYYHLVSSSDRGRLICLYSSEVCVSFSRTNSSLYIYHLSVWSNLISCTIPSGSHSPLSCMQSCTLSLPICCIRLFYYKSFSLYHHITYSWYSIASLSIFASKYLALMVLLFLLISVFHISVNWWSFTRVRMTASLLKSPGLFSVFWTFSIMLLFGWSPFGRQLPNLPGPLIIH